MNSTYEVSVCACTCAAWCLAASLQSTAEGRDGRVKPSPTGNTGRPQLIHYNWEPSGCHVSWLLCPCGVVSLSLSLSLSPSLCLPLSISLSLRLALGITVDYSAVPGLWLLRYGRGQIHAQTHTRPCTHTYTYARQSHVGAQVHIQG